MLPPMTAINTHMSTAVRTVRATERGSATRQHILAVATEELLAHGYTGTSLSDLIRAAGVTKGGFYHHFRSKEALAVEVVRARQAECAELSEDAKLAPQIAGYCEAWIDTAAGLVARAQLQGDIRADVDAHQTAEVLIAAFLGAEQQCVMTARHDDFRADFRARMTRCLDLLLDVFKPVAKQRG